MALSRESLGCSYQQLIDLINLLTLMYPCSLHLWRIFTHTQPFQQVYPPPLAGPAHPEHPLGGARGDTRLRRRRLCAAGKLGGVHLRGETAHRHSLPQSSLLRAIARGG